MKTLKKLGIALMSISLLTACGADDEDYYDDEEETTSTSTSTSAGQYGYCSDFNGSTVVVSVFVDDGSYSWDDADNNQSEVLEKLGVATDWLSKQSSNYGGNGSYIYDFENDSDLYYTYSTSTKCTDADTMADELETFIDENLDLDSIKDSYSADNVLVAFYVNSDDNVEVTDWTIKWESDSQTDYEYCFFYNEVSDGKLTPATIAHEFMHAFGAPDLYSADTDGYNKGITQEYVDELTNNSSNDVMFTTFEQYTEEPVYDKVTNEFSELDAYYVGITDSSTVVNEYGFDASEYDS